jgi:hypothetical protein
MGGFDPIRVAELMEHGEGESRRFSECEGKRLGKCDRTDCDRNLYGLLSTTGVTSMANGAERKRSYYVMF